MTQKPWECGNDEYISVEDRNGLEEFQKKVDGTDGGNWNDRISEVDTDYKVWTRTSEDSPVVLVKSQMTVNASHLEVFKWLAEVDNFNDVMPELDEQCKRVEVINMIDPKHFTLYGSFKTPTPLAHRDFVWTSCCTRMSDEVYSIIGQSCEHESKPPEADSLLMEHVRGIILISGWHLKRIEEGKCLATYLVQCDPKGWIPSTAVNFMASGQGANVQRLVKHFEK